jgi:gamma-glutamyl-gamma-aminobutyrate hydrolase PuuD
VASNASERHTGQRPVIGITSYLERARYGVWDHPAALLPRTYPDAIVRAGGVPVLLPPIGDGQAELVRRLDGLVLAGGADLDPARYQQRTHLETVGVRTDRDAFEFPLLAAAIEADLPVLAICRGMQLLNVALGGSLIQHLPDSTGHQQHRPVPGTFGGSTVELAAGSGIAAILGRQTVVRCHHHQATDVPAPTVEVVGHAADGTCEAIELPGKFFVLGVQWHPEENDEDDRLFAALVAAATSSRQPAVQGEAR